jgi:hypothetical protein
MNALLARRIGHDVLHHILHGAYESSLTHD